MLLDRLTWIAGSFFGAGITLDFNTATVVAIAAAAIAAYPSARLVGSQRRKILAEAGQAADARVLQWADRVQEENTLLRERVAKLEGQVEIEARRVDLLERILVERGIPLPE